MQGLQIFDNNGNTLLDTNLQTTSIFGKLTISSAGHYQVYDERFAWGKPFFLLDAFLAGVMVKGECDNNRYTFDVTHSDQAKTGTVTIYYGVF